MEIILDSERYMVVEDPNTKNLYLIEKTVLEFNFINDFSKQKKRKRKGNFIEEYKNKVRKKGEVLK